MSKLRALRPISSYPAPACEPIFSTPPVSPHVFFFTFYNLLYLLPLLIAFLFGYDEGGVAGVLGVKSQTVIIAVAIYLLGIGSFVIGSSLHPFLFWSKHGRIEKSRSFTPLAVSLPEWLAIALFSTVFVISKIALIPLGVYRSYAFDSGLMGGGVWSFSTFCSEGMIIAGLIVLFSDTRHNVILFLLISAVNGINLLHGTRIFFISSVMSLILYAYVRRKLTYKITLIFGPLFGFAVLLTTYFVFLSRSDVDASGSFTLAKVISPLIYESVFSQMSLLSLIRYPFIWGGLGTTGWFIHDVFLFAAPRLIAPDKDSLQYIGRFDWLSPLGGFNGYAHGLIYFGIFFPVFYFSLGMLASWLYRKSSMSSWVFILYAMLTEDFFLHLIRDGYIISMKMFINATELVGLLIVWRYSIQACRASRLSTTET